MRIKVKYSYVSRSIRCHVFIVMASVFLVMQKGWASGPHDTPQQVPVELVLATGDEKGVYYNIGQEIAAVLHQHQINIRVVPSTGSLRNLELLVSNNVQLCLAQADAVYDVLRGQGAFNHRSINIMALGPLHTETVHILVRNPVLVKRLQDLRGKKISVGPAGGGSELNAMAILESAGVTRDSAAILRQSFEATAQALNGREIEAAFMTMGYPAPLIQVLMESHSVSLFEPDRETIEHLLDAHPGFVLTSIPIGTYSNQDEEVDTLGVPALLLARSDMDIALAERITRLVSEHISEILHNLSVRADRNNTLERLVQLRVPIHPGAQLYYDERHKSLASRLANLANLVLGPCLLCLLLIWAYKKASSISRFFARHPAARALCLLLFVLFLGSIVMYYAERRHNDNYTTYPMAIWSTFVNWISFGAKEPISIVGRINSTFMTVLGMGGISWFVGEIAAFLIRQRLKEARMCKYMKDHFVVINWNRSVPAVLEKIQVMNQEMGEKADLVLISNSKVEVISAAVQLQMDPMSPEIVAASKLQDARSVIILTQDDLPPDVADARNILIVMNIAKLLPKEARKRPHITVEILDPKTARLLNVDNLAVEIVSKLSVATDLIVQVAGNPGLTQIYEDLLTNGEDSSEIYSICLDAQWHNKTFAAICTACAGMREQGHDILPLAISRGGRVHVNPSTASIAVIESGDILFAVCDTLSDLRKINHL